MEENVQEISLEDSSVTEQVEDTQVLDEQTSTSDESNSEVMTEETSDETSTETTTEETSDETSTETTTEETSDETSTETTTEETSEEETNAEVQVNQEDLQMSTSYIALSSLHLIISIILMFVVLQQSKNKAPVSSGLEGGSQTYWNQNKGRSRESILAKATVILAILSFLITLTLNFIN